MPATESTHIYNAISFGLPNCTTSAEPGNPVIDIGPEEDHALNSEIPALAPSTTVDSGSDTTFLQMSILTLTVHRPKIPLY